MARSLRKFFWLAVLLMVVAGCQQVSHQPQPPVQAQLDKLATQLAGGRFLRQNCDRSDIPDDVKLQRTAMRLAEKQGWDTHQASYQQQLAAQTHTRYQALVADKALLSEKCATVNNRTARFIAAAQSDTEDFIL
ncbi:type II secretion system protein S [Serratia fonticola]|jgi:general secretion pathway protein S|uniref:Type II secretion system protein S n=1 Tax=Serratia fonticola TaxID=47917 RepID=A0A542D477_SERFO|nr:type II secretion system pilot lipoprotein GspS [Serratia fonticola]TQI80086.1 type II secretion system protein S [Serratia fonticola]TQI97887.1 type II secretion system protein S [Serratia fonticola]TVZ72385.1 type II secretion system protein S [Serratia fonticola]